MLVREYVELQHLRALFRAPRVRRADPEHLLGRVVEARQLGLEAVSTLPVVVREVGFLDAAVVRYVLALGVDAVQLENFL